MTAEPLFSVLTPVYRPAPHVLSATIASVRAQSLADWELVLVDDGSQDPRVAKVLQKAAAADERVRVLTRDTQGGIVAASNDALAACRGRFVALLDHDDLLEPDALEHVAQALDDDVDYVYTDEDKVDEDGARYDEFRKPDWSPERLRGQMYTAHLSVMRTSVVRAAGGFRQGFDGSQDHDLALRVSERSRQVVHLREVLYHWRAVPGSVARDPWAKPYAWEAGRRAVQDQLDRLRIPGAAGLGPVPGTYRTVMSAPPGLRVSAVVPTRGTAGTVWGRHRVFVVEAVRSLLRFSRIDDLEVVVVYDTVTPESVLDELREVAGDRLVLVPFDGPFNFSAKCNVGAVEASGDVLLFLNDDTEVPGGDGLAPLIGPLLQPDVGMTGARLLFEDGRLQHGGHGYDHGDWFHLRLRAPLNDPGPFAAMLVAREVSGLTAACCAVRADVFRRVGGFCELLPVNFNDVDLSLKLRDAGYRLLWLPTATAYHFESQTREATVSDEEVALVVGRWGPPLAERYFPQGGDPYVPAESQA